MRRLRFSERPVGQVWTSQCRHYASTTPSGGRGRRDKTGKKPDIVAREVAELENTDFQGAEIEKADARVDEYDPVGMTKRRRAQLPASR